MKMAEPACLVRLCALQCGRVGLAWETFFDVLRKSNGGTDWNTTLPSANVAPNSFSMTDWHVILVPQITVKLG